MFYMRIVVEVEPKQREKKKTKQQNRTQIFGIQINSRSEMHGLHIW